MITGSRPRTTVRRRQHSRYPGSVPVADQGLPPETQEQCAGGEQRSQALQAVAVERRRPALYDLLYRIHFIRRPTHRAHASRRISSRPVYYLIDDRS
jgi:hypothetical protein